VLFARNHFGGDGILEGFFGANVQASQSEDDAQQPEGVRAGAKQQGGDDGKSIARGENGAAMRNVIAEPAAEIGGCGVAGVVNGVEDDGETGGAGHAVFGSEHSGGVENQQSVGEIAGTEDAYREKKFAERGGQGLQAVEKRLFFFAGDGTLANQQPEAGDGEQSGNERVEKNFAVGVVGGLEKPQRGERAQNRAERVHETFETEGAAVGTRRNIGGEKSFFGGRADAAAEPGGGAGCEDLQCVCGEAERRGGDGGESIAENCERLPVLEAVGVMTGGEFGEAGKAVSGAFDDAEPGRAGSDDGEESRQDGSSGFVAPIGKQRGKADAQNGAVEPAICGFRLGHERKSTGDGAEVESKCEDGACPASGLVLG